ncbi:ABC transporter permease [Ponticoccus alexandrii]|uniref:ABC transporter permease subunit n=1 Tax=Ponticoccus alexandrii TaxID=1943633 RepID=A0ABX7F9Q0_9RHOB|nr:ABC transporter permease [Ponticoccus alexandrii]ETA51688.2 peptide ABC transporter [Rhodobacteraceae bacterium PD-2]QRF66586.1 ABC transporter permease subunit [Ponticoccus alexandrii]
MAMLIARRLGSGVIVALIVALTVFALLHLSPGDPATVLAGDQASAADIARIRANLGLDRPLPEQFVAWLGGVLHGDFGVSLFSGQPVLALILERMEPTLSLMAFTTLIAVIVAIPAGILAAWRPGSLLERGIGAISIIGFSVPVFVVGYCVAYVFALNLRLLPVQGYAPLEDGFGPWLTSIALPSIALSTSYIALIARTTRAAMIEALQQDYIRTARSKGCSDMKILFVHALRNCALPVSTVIGMGIALLIGGAVATESVFAIPGLGRLLIDAILRGDYPLIQGIVLFFSFVYVGINLVLDLAYGLFDPRVRL